LAAIKDRASHQGRIAIQEALTIYFTEEHNPNDVSQLTFDTVAMQKQYGFSASDLAAAYTQVIHASLMNVVPTAFWVLVHIYSRRELLATLQEETAKVVKQQSLKNGERQVAIEVDQLDNLCPKLMSVFREAHRLASIATLHRRVVEDTFISEGDEANSYLLKKGITVMIPTTVCLRNPSLWGNAAADEFDPKRFLGQSRKHTEDNGAESISNLRKKAYFPFGGGKELCPGRNFATAEVMGIMVVLLNGFDITSADGGPISLPRAGKPKLTTGTARPDRNADLRARIIRRPGWENVVWNTAAASEVTF
jgi:cytochrome P450